MHSKNIDLLNARLAQVSAILNLLDPEWDSSAMWAAHDLLDQAKEASDKLWAQMTQPARIEATA